MTEKVKLQKMRDKRYMLDARGYVCPYPQLLATRALESLSSGVTLELVLDNPPSVDGIPSALTKKGYEVLEVSRVDKGTWKIIVLKSKKPAANRLVNENV